MNINLKQVLQKKYPQLFDNNGALIKNECKKITSIDVEDGSLTSIEGIELFENLQYLKCRGNQLTSLNVQGLTNLRNLDCDKSIQLDVKFIFNTSQYCAFQFSENEIRCGCFRGTLEEFTNAVLSKYSKECAYYKWVISLNRT